MDTGGGIVRNSDEYYEEEREERDREGRGGGERKKGRMGEKYYEVREVGMGWEDWGSEKMNERMGGRVILREARI